MSKLGDDKLIAFLFVIVCLQAYVVFFRNPVQLVRETPDTKPVQDMARPPSRGGGEGRDDQQPTPNGLYAANTPEPPAAEQPLPSGKDPQMASDPKAPRQKGTAGPQQPGERPAKAPDDPYQRLLMGIYAMERDGKQALTPEQARRLLEVVRAAENAKDAVPTAQKTIMQALSPTQKEFIQHSIAERRAQSLPPPPPEGLDALLRRVAAALARR